MNIFEKISALRNEMRISQNKYEDDSFDYLVNNWIPNQFVKIAARHGKYVSPKKFWQIFKEPGGYYECITILNWIPRPHNEYIIVKAFEACGFECIIDSYIAIIRWKE